MLTVETIAQSLASGLLMGLLYGLIAVGLALIFGLMALLLWERHRANLARLAAGTESRIGSGSH